MNDIHRPLALERSPDLGRSGSVNHDSSRARQGSLGIVSTSDSGAGPSRPHGFVVLRDDGSIALNVPTYPRNRDALISPYPAPPDDATTSSSPPPFPSLAPYKDFRPVPWAYLKLLLATQLFKMKHEQKSALSSLDAQARLLQAIVSYIRDELHVHLPCFDDKTTPQLQQILEHDSAFRDTMQRLDTDGELAMRTIAHHLLSRPVPALPPRATPVVSRADAGSAGYSDVDDSYSSKEAESPPQPQRLDDLEATPLDNSLTATLPSFKPRLFKSQVEEKTAQWTNLIWNSGQICRQISTNAPTIEELGRVVHAIVSRITTDSPGAAPLFEDVTPAQFAALLACDPAFESAVRDLQAKASMPDYLSYCHALRLVVNHLCQKRKDVQSAVRRVRIASSGTE